MSLFSKDVGIDLGTANTLVYMKGKGIIMREPSVVAVDTKSDEVRCVGAEAKAVIGRTPGSIVAVRPLKDGVIADFDITANMLETFLKKACGNSMFSRPRVVICIPSGVTEVERRAVREAALKAGARQVSVIEEPMAAAIGAGLPISEPTGSMIVDIGGGTAEIAVISLGGIVASRSVRMAGDMFDQAIIAFIKRKYNLLKAKKYLADVYENGEVNLVDIGFVGSVKEVNTALINCLLDGGYIPVIAPTGVGDKGETYNINADVAAGEIAGALKAEKLLVLTDVRGIYSAYPDESSFISTLTFEKAHELILKGSIDGGMIPKVRSCIKALSGGAKKTHIIDGRAEHSILMELFSDKGVGTEVVKEI